MRLKVALSLWPTYTQSRSRCICVSELKTLLDKIDFIELYWVTRPESEALLLILETSISNRLKMGDA